MSHVDDGTLHAYLDGELSPVERARLETHLAECTACRGRLDEERVLIERAGQLLGLATPPERAIPPLHQLRHPRPRMRWRVPVAWAATVVLAIAAGWYARGSGSRGAPYTLYDQAQQPATEMRDLAAAAPADSAAVARDASKASGRADEAKTRVPTVAQTERYIQPPPVAEHDALQRAEEAAPAPQPAAPAASPTAGAGLAARQQSRFDSSLVVSTVTVGTVKPMPVISADSAVRLLKTDLAVVPSLPIQSIRPLPGGAVQVEQAVDSTTSIMLYQWPADSPRFARESELARGYANTQPAQPRAASRAPAGERLARYVRGLRVEISGPMSVDSLNRLLGLVR